MKSFTLFTAFAAATAIATLPFASFADDSEEPGGDPVDVWAEISYDDIPAEVTNRTGALIPLDAVAYIQTGLMGHFDAIRNAGIDQPHNPTATEWKNLASGYPDAEFVGNVGYWRNGYSFYSTGDEALSYVRLKSELNVGSKMAVQLVTTIDSTKQYNGSNIYNIFFRSPDNEFSLYYQNTSASAKTQKLIMKADKFGGASGNRPAINPWDGRYITAMVDSDIRLLGETASSIKSKTTTPSKTFNYKFHWCGTHEGGRPATVGDYHAVRIYNAELTAEQLAWNRRLDEVRYRGADTNVNVVVWSDAAGIEGTQMNGKYMVNGHCTFTAPASVTTNGCTYALAGYTLEVWDSTTNAWRAAEVHVGESSFAYTNCLARSKVRLTWNWNMTSGAKPLDADEYVQNGLVLNFDGIRNSGFGLPHDTNTTTWANLGTYGGAGIAEKTAIASSYWHANSADGSWDADGYRFKSRNYFAMANFVNLGLESTAQVVADYDNAEAKKHFVSNGIRWPCFFGGIDLSNRFNLYVNVESDNADKVYSYSHANSSYRPNTTDWDGRFINRTFDATTANTVTLTSSYGASWKTGTKTLPANTSAGIHRLAIGTEGENANGYYCHILHGKVCAVRFYDRVLSSDEIAYNRAIDEARFFGRFANLDAMDAVLVRSESPDGKVKIDGEGAYIVRNASKSFSAPATLTVDGKTYTCTGYRIETWNSTTRQWNTDSTGSILSVELSSTTTGAANRRLTWFWRITQGLRTAADFTAFDYVQDGLMGNFDGIINHGADHLHNTYTRTWRNLVADQPSAAFNTANGTWAGNAFNFTGNVQASVEDPGINVGGPNLSIQLATVVDWTQQPHGSGYYAIFFGNPSNDAVVFINNTSTTASSNKLQFNVDTLGISSWKNRPTFEPWEGQYATAILGDGVTYLVQGTTLTGGKTRTNTTVPARNFSWGGQGGGAKAYAKGTYHSVRIYNRALTEAELVQNRKVDEIRFRGNFADYANLIIATNGAVTASTSIPAGEYELAGSVTITAANVVESGKHYYPKLRVETWNGSAWVAGAKQDGSTYTATDSQRVRLTYTWERKGFMVIVR